MDERFAHLLERGQRQLLRAFAPIFSSGLTARRKHRDSGRENSLLI
jgi:hypothetical protein